MIEDTENERRDVRERDRSIEWLAPSAGVVAGAALFAFALRRWRASRTAARDPAEAMYVELDRALARHGLARPTTRTPLEHLAFVEASGFDEVAAVRAVTEAYARARYGGRGLTPEEKRGLAAAVERVRRGGE